MLKQVFAILVKPNPVIPIKQNPVIPACPESPPVRRAFTILEFLLYTVGLLIMVQAICMATRLTMQVAQSLPPYVDLVRMHLPAVRQLCRDAGQKDVAYSLEKECLYRQPDGGRRICIARGVRGVSFYSYVARHSRIKSGAGSGQLSEQNSAALGAGPRALTPAACRGSLVYITTSGWHIEETLSRHPGLGPGEEDLHATC